MSGVAHLTCCRYAVLWLVGLQGLFLYDVQGPTCLEMKRPTCLETKGPTCLEIEGPTCLEMKGPTCLEMKGEQDTAQLLSFPAPKMHVQGMLLHAVQKPV